MDRVREEFLFQAAPRFQELWEDLSDQERNALRSTAGTSGLVIPAAGMINRLQRHGLLRPDGQLFSRVFTKFVRGQR